MASLPPPQPIAMRLYADGVSHAVIAEVLDTPEGTVKSWVSRTLLKWRNEMDTKI